MHNLNAASWDTGGISEGEKERLFCFRGTAQDSETERASAAMASLESLMNNAPQEKGEETGDGRSVLFSRTGIFTQALLQTHKSKPDLHPTAPIQRARHATRKHRTGCLPSQPKNDTEAESNLFFLFFSFKERHTHFTWERPLQHGRLSCFHIYLNPVALGSHEVFLAGASWPNLFTLRKTDPPLILPP